MAKKKKCCSYLQSARLSSQTKFALILISLIFIVLIVGTMILKIYLISSFTYKEIFKLIDIDEFNELNFAENNLENAQLQFENTFKNTLLTIVNLYKHLSNTSSTIDLLREPNNEYEFEFWNGTIKEPSSSPKKRIIYSGENEIDFKEDIVKNYYSYLFIYLEKIFSNKKIFMNINDEGLMHLLIFCDYEEDITFYYPGYTNEIKIIDKNIIKQYVMKKLIQKVKYISMFQEILSNKIDYYDNLFLLPYYDENKDNNDYNLTYEIFNEKFISEKNIKINGLAFMIVPTREIRTQSHIDINMTILNETIGQIFLLIGINDTNEIIFDKIINQQAGLSLLRTEYLFPYELTSKSNCYNILHLGLNENDEQYQRLNNLNISQLKYLDDCLDKTTKLKKYKNNKQYSEYTTYDKIIEDFSIFRNNISNYYNSNIVKLYNIIEKRYIQKINTSLSRTVTKAAIINNEVFKIKKAYSPLNIMCQIDYFHPIDNIKMNILIKSEDYSTILLRENKDILNSIILTGITYLIISVLIIEVIIIIILKYFAEELNKPLDILNNPSFITGQIKEGEYENKNKSLNKLNINSDNIIHIDEFKDLVKSVSEALKSETEFEQKINKQEEDDMKLEMENLNKEFEKNKIFNIMVDEYKIYNILEENNYSNEIIKHKTNIENLKNDSFVKKSYLFREYVKINEFEEFENSGENSLEIDNNNIFKDENTLQNPNSLFYELFKTEFDESYVRRTEELKIKKEIEKKRKNKGKTYTFKTDKAEEEIIKEKIKKSIKKNEIKDRNNINNIINEEEENKLNEDEFDINNENEEENNLSNYFNNKNNEEDKILKLYTEGLNEKE